MGRASGAVMSLFIPSLSLSFPRCYSTLYQFYFSFPPGYYSTFNSVVFDSSLLPTSSRSFTPLLSSFFFLLFQLIVSETVINLDWPGWDRRAATLTDGEEFTGLQVKSADGLGLRCTREELLSEDARWWADVLLGQAWRRGENGLEQWFYKLHLTPVHFCGTMSLCTWCSSRIQKRTQLFFDKNKLTIAVQSYTDVGPVGHKHTAAKYSCHSSQLIWRKNK